jgi:hypothetical protein
VPCPAQIFGGDHKITQWMTSPSLEALGGEKLMGAGKQKDTHMKQVQCMHALTVQHACLKQL